MFKSLRFHVQWPQPKQLLHLSLLHQSLLYETMRPSFRLPRRVATFFTNQIRREGRNDSLERGMPEPDFYASMFGPVESQTRLKHVAREIARRQPSPLPANAAAEFAAYAPADRLSPLIKSGPVSTACSVSTSAHATRPNSRTRLPVAVPMSVID